jgi:hypothetical protein
MQSEIESLTARLAAAEAAIKSQEEEAARTHDAWGEEVNAYAARLAEAEAAAREALECFDIVTRNAVLSNLTVDSLRVELLHKYPWLGSESSKDVVIMKQPEGLQQELLKMNRESRSWLLEVVGKLAAAEAAMKAAASLPGEMWLTGQLALAECLDGKGGPHLKYALEQYEAAKGGLDECAELGNGLAEQDLPRHCGSGTDDQSR